MSNKQKPTKLAVGEAVSLRYKCSGSLKLLYQDLVDGDEFFFTLLSTTAYDIVIQIFR